MCNLNPRDQALIKRLAICQTGGEVKPGQWWIVERDLGVLLEAARQEGRDEIASGKAPASAASQDDASTGASSRAA
jgi:hypothetical protein